MADYFAVDTHALIWFLQGDTSRLGIKAQEILALPESNLLIPAIVLAEASHIIMRGRTNIPSCESLIQAIVSDSRFTVVPLYQRIVERSFTLSLISELHDRLIVATALELNAPSTPVSLISKDANIRASGIIPVVW
jgi:PIN domain nuclease of toxin-antitoxin system